MSRVRKEDIIKKKEKKCCKNYFRINKEKNPAKLK